MDDNPEIRDRLNVNKSTYHNKRPRERFICFIRGAKWMKINQLNGPSPIHDTSTWLSQSIQSIIHVCHWLGMQKNLPWKRFRTAFGHYDFRSTSTSQQAWRMRKRYHLLLPGVCLTSSPGSSRFPIWLRREDPRDKVGVCFYDLCKQSRASSPVSCPGPTNSNLMGSRCHLSSAWYHWLTKDCILWIRFKMPKLLFSSNFCIWLLFMGEGCHLRMLWTL